MLLRILSISATDYRWWKFLHLIGVLGFFLAHGVSVAVGVRLRRERDRERIRTLLALSHSSIAWLNGALVVLLTGGIGGGIAGHWWGQRWIRIGAGLLGGFIVLAVVAARPYYTKVRAALEPDHSDAELDALLSSPMSILVTALGFATLIAIAWLMIFKPA